MSPTATITRASSAKLGKQKAQAGGQNREIENESNEAEPSDVSKTTTKNAASQSEMESAIVQDVLQEVGMNIDESVRSLIANRLAQFQLEKLNKTSNPPKRTKGPKDKKHENSSKKKNDVKQKDSNKGTASGVVAVRRSKRLNGGRHPSDPGDDGPDDLPDESSGDETYSLMTSDGDGINASADGGGSSPDDDSNYGDHGDGSNGSDFESQSSGGSNDVVEVKASFTNPFKIAPFDGKDWTTYREDIRAVAERQGVWNIMCGKEMTPNKSLKPKKYGDFQKRAAIANELLITSLDKSSKVTM
ncbi:unnamed protein product [Aphanomyces euteiches]